MESRVRPSLKATVEKFGGSFYITGGKYRLPGKVSTFPTLKARGSIRLRGMGYSIAAKSRRRVDGTFEA
jgi:hypothetical protein